MRLSMLLIALSLPVSSWAAGNPYANDREGRSYHISDSEMTQFRTLERVLPRDKITKAFNDSVLPNQVKSACAFTLVSDWEKAANRFAGYRQKNEFALKALRYYDLIDDTVLKVSLRAMKVLDRVDDRLKDRFSTPSAAVVSANKNYQPFLNFSQKRERGKCLDEALGDLLSEYRQLDKKITLGAIDGWSRNALKIGFITEKAQAEIAAAIDEKFDTWPLSLDSYVEKRQWLRAQFPLQDNGTTDFIAQKAPGKDKSSYRERLYEQYSTMQMVMMADLIKKLKSRLNSPKITITVYDNDLDDDGMSFKVGEVIDLDPLERFHFAIKLTRKEMRLLGINSLMSGRTPAYTDLIAAAYELGMVASSEVTTVASLQEIWDPKKSWWEKAQPWVRVASGVASVALPQPFGYIPTLAVVVIQAVMQEQPDDDTDELFGGGSK